MRTKTFKTLKGVFDFLKRNQITISEILNGHFYLYPKRYKIVLEGKALEQLADKVSKYLYKGKEKRERIRNAVIEHHTDKEGYLQCFCLWKSKDGGFYISNSLSGEGFEYCRRRFFKTIL